MIPTTFDLEQSGTASISDAFKTLHNWGCSWGLDPPVSRSARVM